MEAEWEAREPGVSGVRLELDQSATAGSLRVRILSHTVGGLRHCGAVVTPEGAEPGSLPVVLFTHGEDDGVAVELTFLLTPITSGPGPERAFVVPSYRSEPLRLGNQVFPSEGLPSPWDWDVDDMELSRFRGRVNTEIFTTSLARGRGKLPPRSGGVKNRA